MKSSQKLLNTQMDKAEHLVLVQSSLLFKDLCEHSWVHWGCSDIDATPCQVWFTSDQVSFLQLLKSQFSKIFNYPLVLYIPDWICFSSSIIPDILQFQQNHKEVEGHLSQHLGQLSSLSGFQHILQNCCQWDQTPDKWEEMHGWCYVAIRVKVRMFTLKILLFLMNGCFHSQRVSWWWTKEEEHETEVVYPYLRICSLHCGCPADKMFTAESPGWL